MKNVNDYKVGQRVKMYDKDDACNVYGHVLEVRERSLVIKWGDLHDPCEHFEDEFELIKPGLPDY